MNLLFLLNSLVVACVCFCICVCVFLYLCVCVFVFVCVCVCVCVVCVVFLSWAWCVSVAVGMVSSPHFNVYTRVFFVSSVSFVSVSCYSIFCLTSPSLLACPQIVCGRTAISSSHWAQIFWTRVPWRSTWKERPGAGLLWVSPMTGWWSVHVIYSVCMSPTTVRYVVSETNYCQSKSCKTPVNTRVQTYRGCTRQLTNLQHW